MKKLSFNCCNKRRIFSFLIALIMVTLTIGEISAQTTVAHVFGTIPLPQPSRISATSTGTQNGRLFRSGTATTCVSNPPASNFNVGTTLQYEAYSFYAATDGCINVSVAGTPTGLYVALYSGSYDPLNYTANCVGQQGSSGDVNFGATLVANQLYTLVFTQVSSGTTGTYTVNMDNVGFGTPVPVSPWWIAALFLLMGIFAVYKFTSKTSIIARSKNS